MSKREAFLRSPVFKEIREIGGLTPDHIWRALLAHNPQVRKIRAHLVKELSPDQYPTVLYSVIKWSSGHTSP